MPKIVVIGEVSNPDWIAAYGRMQKVYRQEDGVNATEVAKNLLNGVERRGSISAIGHIDAITGYALGIKDEYTGMCGIFQIDSDVHTWENGMHTMNLNVNFDEIMDMNAYRSKKKKAANSVTLNWDV